MSSLTLPQLRSERIALCYVRLSWTREGDDTQSPDRQRANILKKCQEEGLTPVWFEDVDGHKSGREVKNRPGWQALIQHLDHPNVVAVVANDLSRLHRKGWRIGKLIDTLEQRHISLITAAPGKQIDTSTTMGKFVINITATFDEQYADDIADK
ncbi:MAG: recombinase family protein, partial [Anaerolineae bacterium]|nr:recombinase family protein [Anaerolineae bacterium]